MTAGAVAVVAVEVGSCDCMGDVNYDGAGGGVVPCISAVGGIDGFSNWPHDASVDADVV